jgi:transposase
MKDTKKKPHEFPAVVNTNRGKEISPENRQAIIDLSADYSPRKIAPRVGLSRKIVLRVLLEEGLLQPKKRPKQNKLDAFFPKVAELVEKELTVTRILREIQELGYQGSRTILGEHVGRLRAQRPLAARKKIRCRFETALAAEMQVDWSLYTVSIAGKPTKVHALGIILASCRKVYYGVYRNERQFTLLEGLARGLEYFQGCALRLVFDNMVTAVLGRVGPERKPLWHPRMLEFAQYYGFEPYACAVRDPDRKGKKEKSFRYFEDDFIKGSTFDSWDDLEIRLRMWLDHTPGAGNLRIHGTTGLVPNEAFLAEKPLLMSLPDRRFPVAEEVIRPVDQDCTISVSGKRYSVPSILACKNVSVRQFAHHFEVSDSHGQMVFTRKYVDPLIHKGSLVIDPTHYANQPRRTKDRWDGGRLDRAFVARFPSLEVFVNGLKTRLQTIAPIHLRKLLRLADCYGHEAFLAAAEKAQQHRSFIANTVERILEREYPLPPEDTVSPLGGLGPGILGDVAESTLDDFAHLDAEPDTDKENNDDQK